MAVTQTEIVTSNVPGPGGFRVETSFLEWTSTTATVDLSSRLSKVLGVFFARVGDVDASDAGYLSVNESLTGQSGERKHVTVGATTAGKITVVRQPLLAAGTLTTEAFSVVVIGY